MIAAMKDILAEAEREGRGVAAFNVFGYEDAKAVAQAAEELGLPTILMANKAAVAHMGAARIGWLMRSVAQEASVPIGIHLDHATDPEVIGEALEAGFTSVMFDGSRLPTEENVRQTREIVEKAHTLGVGVEGEIGFVGYSDGSESGYRYTEPEEAAAFCAATGVDAVAVAVGTVHRMREQTAVLQFDRLAAIHATVDTPLVIHGSTGVADEDLYRLVRSGARKINIGTALRMAFGNCLRAQMEADPGKFDRIEMFGPCMQKVRGLAAQKLRLLAGL